MRRRVHRYTGTVSQALLSDKKSEIEEEPRIKSGSVPVRVPAPIVMPNLLQSTQRLPKQQEHHNRDGNLGNHVRCIVDQRIDDWMRAFWCIRCKEDEA